MFYALGHVFDGIEGVGSPFHVLRSYTRFRRYRGRRIPFSCFALPNSFSAVPRASGPVFIFYAPGHVFGDIEGVGSRFHVLRSRAHFRLYQGRRVPFSCLAFPDTFSTVWRASCHVFMFCVPGFCFRRYRVRRVPFSSFALPKMFSAVPRASGPVFMFCAPRVVFGGTKGVRSHLHVLRFRTRFQRYRGCPVLFSCFALPHSFSAVPRTSGPVFMFCAPRVVFGGTEGFLSRFHVLRARTPFR
jgi:hypothetical protein